MRKDIVFRQDEGILVNRTLDRVRRVESLCNTCTRWQCDYRQQLDTKHFGAIVTKCVDYKDAIHKT